MAFRCVGIGEVLWDLLPAGRQLGGAPANFAYHAATLGADALVVSRVGRDRDGRQLLRALRQLGLSTRAIGLDSAAPTSTVSVRLAADGQPRYTIHEGVAWDYLAAEPPGRKAVATADVICFGTLAQRSPQAREAIRTLLALAPVDSLRVFDVNLRQHYYSRDLITESLDLANVVKFNDVELPLLARMFALPGNEQAQLAELVRRFGLRAAVCTRGERGSLVYADGIWCEQAGQPVVIADTVGAGDSFTAAFALGLLHGWRLATIVSRATAVSAYVCSQPGATPPLPAALSAPFRATGATA